MITRKEMGYVTSKSINAPFPGEEYCQIILNKLKKCYELYNANYLNKKYTIQFSNNEEVDLAIQEKNISHLLGIDYKNLIDDFYIWYRSNILGLEEGKFNSYKVLGSIIENMDRVIEYDKDNLKCDAINYYKVGIKCDIFSKLTDLSNFHYGCINFNRETFEQNNPDLLFNPRSTKFLYTPSDEVISPYFFMGIKKDDYDSNNQFIVETLMAVDNPVKFFGGQEVIIPTQILTDNNGILGKKKASASEKVKLIREYQNIVNEYDLENKLNIFGDYFSILMNNKNEEESNMTLKK